MNEEGIEYWSEPITRKVKTRTYPKGKLMKESPRAFMLFKEYRDMPYLKNRDGRSHSKLLKQLQAKSDVNVDLSWVTISHIMRFSKRWEWVKRVEAYDSYREQLTAELNQRIMLETLNTNCRTALHDAEILTSLSRVAGELYKRVLNGLKDILDDRDYVLKREDADNWFKVFRGVQRFFLENADGMNGSLYLNSKSDLNKAIKDEIVESSFVELLRDPDEFQRIIDDANDYTEQCKEREQAEEASSE